jgi:beta-lactamase regulating signal transducer with metallopeptidase domain
MTWQLLGIDLLARAAIGGFIILAIAAVAVRLCRQPADRVRMTELALVGAFLVPWMALVPGLPRWSIGLMPAEPVHALTAQEPTPLATGTTAPDVGQSDSRPTAMRPETPVEAPTVRRDISAASDIPESAPPTPSVETPTSVVSEPSWSIAGLIMLAYGIVTGAMLGWSILGLWRLLILRRNSRLAAPELIALLRNIAGPASDRVRLLVSDRIDAPVTFTGLHSVIVLPADLCAQAKLQEIKFGLAHEWSHVERGDVWRWYLVTLAQVVLFYQPLFWWLRRQLRLSQDYLADARAAEQAGDSIDYAEHLVSLGRQRLSRPALALGINDRRPFLTRRIHMLLLNSEPLARSCRFAWTAGAALAAFIVLAGTSAIRLGARELSNNEAAPTQEAKADEPMKPAQPATKGETLNYTGKVVDKDTKKPIAGAVVVVRRSLLGDPERQERNPVIEETKHTTDAEGRYAFTIPPKQSCERYLYIELDFEHPDYAPQKGFGYALSMILKNEKLGGRPFFEEVELRPGKPVTGQVRTPDGKPAAGVKVMAYSVTSKRTQAEFEYGSFADTRTDAGGKFRLTLVSPGWGVVWVLPQQFAPETHVVKDKRGDLGVFTLQDGPRLRGKVLDAKGAPLAGLTVNAESRDRNDEITEPVADAINRSAVTNDKGEFELNPLPPGNYLVKPDDYAHDGSIDRKDRKALPVSDVFLGAKTTLKAGVIPEPIEVRATPHVVIEAQYLDAQGKPTRGHACHITGKLDGVFWFAEAKVGPDGKMVGRVPHGLENTQMSLMTNEHGVLRWRKGKGEPLNNTRIVRLNTMNDDVKGIEIIRYTAPILLVKVAAKDGSKPVNPAVTALYVSGKGQHEGKLIVAGGRESDVSFEKQEDGRFRSSQLLPDEEVTIVGHADGYSGKLEKIKLAENTTKEIELTLEKTPAKEDEKKEK